MGLKGRFMIFSLLNIKGYAGCQPMLEPLSAQKGVTLSLPVKDRPGQINPTSLFKAIFRIIKLAMNNTSSHFRSGYRKRIKN